MAHVIPAALKRDVILSNAMRAFKARILPVMAFAYRMNNVALQGTNKILVPYWPLETSATKDFNGTYEVDGGSVLTTKEVAVTERKYQTLAFTSDEWNRQPFLDLERIVLMKVEKLAADILAHIWSVITAANYPGASIAAIAASAFDFDEVLALRRICNESDWPNVGRSLVLDSTYIENLLKDTRLGNQNAGSVAPVRDGRFGGTLAGFEPFEVPLMPENEENLVGVVTLPSSLAVAFSPIQPAPAVQKTLQEYRIITDPDTNLSLEYRVWGDPDTDKQKEIIECNYGFATLETAGLKRIVKPAAGG